MPEALVLDAAEATGLATVREVPAPGMIALKGDLEALAPAVTAATGCAVPGTRGIVASGEARAAWMAPDELLLIVPRTDVAGVLASLGEGLAGMHHLAADVSDMRAVFRIEGADATVRETLAKLCPVDLAPGVFEEGEIRRTRLAQVPAAFWLEDGGATLVCFRSVARYAFDVLKGAAAEGGAVGYFGEA
ncbi:MAG: sarcosine oxidase subunit gamma family protein [Paracoccaceae bacterium]|jgi:sarcosine oxidase subunit gamma|nr:sarcosine oxidase subunit gamma family protein [Paracoccaceae bacterium]